MCFSYRFCNGRNQCPHSLERRDHVCAGVQQPVLWTNLGPGHHRRGHWGHLLWTLGPLLQRSQHLHRQDWPCPDFGCPWRAHLYHEPTGLRNPLGFGILHSWLSIDWVSSYSNLQLWASRSQSYETLTSKN